MDSVQQSPAVKARNNANALAALANLDLAQLQIVLQDHMARRAGGPRFNATVLMNVARDLEAMPWNNERRIGQ